MKSTPLARVALALSTLWPTPLAAQTETTLSDLVRPSLVAEQAGRPQAPPARRPAAAAKTPAVTFRPFFLVAGEQFAASKTFDAVFGMASVRPFFGGGVQVTWRRGFFVEVGVSRFSSTGQRVFVSDGRTFPLGIPLLVSVTPVDITGGYRFPVSKSLIPYVAAGLLRDAYAETSNFNETSDDLNTAGTGFVVRGGVEFRVHRLVGVGVDAHYAQVTGVLGTAGASKAFGENDLGGIGVRVRLLFGR